MTQKILVFVKWCIAATFFVPLVVVPSSFIFPFIVPKILLFRSLVELMLGGYALLLVSNWQLFKPKLTALTMAMIAFLVCFGVSTFSGVDPYHSFWDNHERMLGLFTIIHYVIYYFVASGVIKGWNEWKIMLKVFLVAGATVMFLGVLQVGNPQFLLNQGSDRVASTLGNSIYVGGYGLFLFFVAYLLCIKEKAPLWRWIAIVSGFLALLGIFFSGARGSLLGLAVGILLALIMYSFTLEEYPRYRLATRWILVGMVLLGVLLSVGKNTALVKAVPVLERTFNTSVHDITGSARWIAWRIALESWREKPLFGWGPNNFFYAFNKYYDPHSLEFGYGETWFDNAHNVIVNTLAVQGAVGLLSYLAIFAVAIVALSRAWRRKIIDQHIAIVGIAFLAAHLVQNVTVFENPTSYLYFVFWLAMTQQLAHGSPPEITVQKAVKKIEAAMAAAISSGKKIGPLAVGCAGVVIGLVIIIANLQPARANFMALETLKVVATGDTNATLAVAKEAVSFNSPHIDDIRNDVGRAITSLLEAHPDAAYLQKNKELFALSISAMSSNLALHPYDIRTHLLLGHVYEVEGNILHNAPLIQQAESLYQQALSYSPHRQQVLFALAVVELELGKNDQAIALYQQALNEDPAVGEPYVRLAYLYANYGKIKEAQDIIRQAQERKVKIPPQFEEFVQKLMADTSTIPAVAEKAKSKTSAKKK